MNKYSLPDSELEFVQQVHNEHEENVEVLVCDTLRESILYSNVSRWLFGDVVLKTHLCWNQ